MQSVHLSVTKAVCHRGFAAPETSAEHAFRTALRSCPFQGRGEGRLVEANRGAQTCGGYDGCRSTLTSWSWFLSPMLIDRLALEITAAMAYKLMTISATLFRTNCSSTIV